MTVTRFLQDWEVLFRWLCFEGGQMLREFAGRKSIDDGDSLRGNW